MKDSYEQEYKKFFEKVVNDIHSGIVDKEDLQCFIKQEKDHLKRFRSHFGDEEISLKEKRVSYYQKALCDLEEKGILKEHFYKTFFEHIVEGIKYEIIKIEEIKENMDEYCKIFKVDNISIINRLLVDLEKKGFTSKEIRNTDN